MFVAGDFVDDEAGLGDPDVDQGLDFKAVAVDSHVGQTAGPEGVLLLRYTRRGLHDRSSDR